VQPLPKEFLLAEVVEPSMTVNMDTYPVCYDTLWYKNHINTSNGQDERDSGASTEMNVREENELESDHQDDNQGDVESAFSTPHGNFKAINDLLDELKGLSTQFTPAAEHAEWIKSHLQSSVHV